MRPDLSRFLGELFLFGMIAFPAAAQQPCPVLPVAPPAPGTNIFSPQQEVDLGDVIAEQIQREFRVIDDEDVTGYLQGVGERLLKHLPETNLKFRFYLFDVPILNAWSLPGGRIYVSRKMVALLRNEDELAGLLGHEMGHLVARQPAVDMTMLFREVLGVTRLGDRRDIFDQYNKMVENIARKPEAFHHSENREQREQFIADQIGMTAAAASGYPPQSLVDLFDRMAQTKGKTGNWLSDLFGTTNPESKRLRELMHNVSAMPVGCIEARQPAPPDEFRQWQSAVIAYSGLGHKEQLHAVLQRKALDPPLRGELSRLQFSPDGKYLLAQDESNLYVLTRDPLEIKFRLDAPDASPARFTPDSQEVVFYTPSLRVERWNVAEERRAAVNELVIPGGCLQTLLSPDARVLACLGDKWDLSLYDVAAGSLLFQKKNFHIIVSFAAYMNLPIARTLGLEIPLVRMGFTPDARYFAASAGAENSLILDVAAKREVTFPASARKLLFYNFAFLSPDRLIGVDHANPKNSAIVKFPSGEIVERVPLGVGTLEATQNPRFILVRPVINFSVGLLDLQEKKFIMASKAHAMDVAGEICINERRNGEVGLYRLGASQAALALSLPRGSLGPLRAQAVSRDLRWLAISQRWRGGVWDLEKGQLAFSVAGFRGAYFANDGIAYAEFPKSEQSQRRIGRMHLGARFLEDGMPVVEDDDARQYGSVLLRATRKDKNSVGNSRNVAFDALDVRTGVTLWSRAFPKEAPDVWADPDGSRFVLGWPATSDGVRNEIRNDPSLIPRVAAAKFTDRDVFVEVLDAHSGKTLGALLVLTGKGSFQILHALSSRDWVIVSDNLNRLLVYSLSTGEEKGKFFGRHPAVSAGRDLLAAGNEQGQLVVYDLATMSKREEFVFSSPLAFTAFDGEGKRLFVLTESQTAYVLDVSGAGRASR